MIIALPLPEQDPILEIALRNTSLEVEPSGDGSASARFIAAGEDSPQDTGERFAVRTGESDDGGPPVVSVEEQRLDDAIRGCLLVQVPEQTRLRLRSRNGGIEVRDLAGQLHVRTRNGAINVRNNRGLVSAAAANGAIHLCAVSAASVDVAAANGSVNLSDIETPRLRVSTSNGRVRVAGARIGGGTVRSANGRIALQIAPLAAAAGGAPDAPDPVAEPAAAEDSDGGEGRLMVYSANGPVTVALPERINATVKARTGGVLRNHLGSARSRTDRSVTTLQFGDGEPELLILINNLRGGIEVTKHGDFESGSRTAEEEAFSDDDARHHGVWFDIDFSEEFPRFMRDMKEFGMKFGRLGEEVSREMRRAFRFGGAEGERHGPRPGHGERSEPAGDEAGGARRGDTGAEVKTVLDLLKEGKISVEEAERLIAALRH